MIVVRLQGGLGNQMFQYAAALRLATKHGSELKLDLCFYCKSAPKITPRGYDLDLFRIPERAASETEVRRFRRLLEPGGRSLLERAADKLAPPTVFQEATLDFDPRVLELPNDSYLEGYFQNERYFADIIPMVRERFQFPEIESELPPETWAMAEQIKGGHSVCVNVRRGDYITNPTTNQHHGVCSAGYYRRGAELLCERNPGAHFYVFSDDPEWAASELVLPEPCTHVPNKMNGDRYFHKFWLMTLCKHFIIANSSFGWWAAWLADSPAKQVVRPVPWLKAVPDFDNCPTSWAMIAAQ